MLFGWTQGNAFFLEEIIKALVANGRISSKQGVWIGWDAEDFSLPRTIREAVLGRIEPFSDDAQTVAELAAVIGTRASYPLLEAISGLPQAALLSALEELCAHLVLKERAEAGTVVYDFAHPLVQQTLYGEFGLQRAPGPARGGGRSDGGLLRPRIDGSRGRVGFPLRPDRRGAPPRQGSALFRGGRQALERRADQEAVNYLRSALERTDSGDTDGPTRADLVPHLARAHQHLGEFEAAVELWTSTLAEVAGEHPKHPAVRRALGMAHLWCGRHDDAQEHLDIGLESARALGYQAELVRLTIAKGHVLNELGMATEAIETVLLALPIAEGLASPHLLARVHRALALLHVWIGPPHTTREHATRALELAREVGGLSIELWARWALAVLSGMSGATDEMAAAIDELNDLAARWRSPVLRLWSAEMAIELAWGRGDWDAGTTLGEQAITLARNLNQRTLLPRLLVWTSLFYVGRGQHEQAQALVDEAAEISGLGNQAGPIDVHQVVPAYIGLAHYLLGLGEYKQAIEAAENGLRIAEGTEYVLWAIHRLLPVLGEACLWAGEIDRAEAVSVRMREHARQLDHKLGFCWADAIDALVCRKRGDPESAIDLMRQAAEALEEIPMIPDAARIRRQLAGRLAEIDRPDDSAEELKRVYDIFLKLGAELELEKTRIQFREIGHRPPPRGIGKGVAGLTARELEVARLVAQRLSNKAIGRKLGMATRTASTHLSNIFQKIEVGSRGELADLIREKGLLEE